MVGAVALGADHVYPRHFIMSTTMYAVVSSCIGTVKLMRLVPIVLAGVILSGRGLNLLVEPWFWIALMLALAFCRHTRETGASEDPRPRPNRGTIR